MFNWHSTDLNFRIWCDDHQIRRLVDDFRDTAWRNGMQHQLSFFFKTLPPWDISGPRYLPYYNTGSILVPKTAFGSPCRELSMLQNLIWRSLITSHVSDTCCDCRHMFWMWSLASPGKAAVSDWSKTDETTWTAVGMPRHDTPTRLCTLPKTLATSFYVKVIWGQT